jgi:hypothetical protein
LGPGRIAGGAAARKGAPELEGSEFEPHNRTASRIQRNISGFGAHNFRRSSLARSHLLQAASSKSWSLFDNDYFIYRLQYKIGKAFMQLASTKGAHI